MDLMSINDLIFECLRAVVMVLLLLILFLRGNFTSLARHPGWKSILTGFCLITLATLIDLTDEIPGLERFVIIGDTIYEAFLEKVPGYLLGFVLVTVGFYRMIPSLQKAEQYEKASHESEERFRKIFMANPDAVLLTMLDCGRIIAVNPAFEEQTGLHRDDVLGRRPAELGLWDDAETWEGFARRLRETGSVDNVETLFKARPGEFRSVLISAQVVTLSGEPCALTVVRDITRLKEAEQALLEVDRIRSEFISTAAHELRTPLSVVTGYAELLTDPEACAQFSPRQQAEFLTEIKAKGFVLSQIVDDLLDLNRIDSGLMFGLQLDSISPDSLLAKAFEQFQVRCSSHRFRLELARDEQFKIECDGQRLVQILENLLSNAIKYSPPGSLVSLVSRHHRERYEFSVCDQGIGLTPDQVGRVFDKFYRVDSSNTAAGGLGLGLSIVRQIVESHNGSITIDSTFGQGTCVTVRLPKTVNPAASA